jgi:hypothetical protein
MPARLAPALARAFPRFVGPVRMGESEPHLSPTVMPQSVLVEMTLPRDWQTFRLPPALDDRLHELLDRQDRDGKLSPRERREAAALAGLVDFLALLRAQAGRISSRSAS